MSSEAKPIENSIDALLGKSYRHGFVTDIDSDTLPPLYVGCGTEDELNDGNMRFVDAAVADGVDVHVDFRPGEHEWGLWDATVRDVLAWLPLAR